MALVTLVLAETEAPLFGYLGDGFLEDLYEEFTFLLKIPLDLYTTIGPLE